MTCTGMTSTWPRRRTAVLLLVAALVTMPRVGAMLASRIAAADAVDDDAQSIELLVSQALADDLGPDAAHLEVHARSGVVTLVGIVVDEAMRDRAEKVAYGVVAVERVENRLRILRAPINPREM